MAIPFEGCTPAPDSAHAAWIVDALSGRDGVAFIVPDRFERCVRVHHPLAEGDRWADAGPQYLCRGTGSYGYPFPAEIEDVSGDLREVAVDRLVEILKRVGPGDIPCHYALWTGRGDLHAGSNTIVYQDERPGVMKPGAWSANSAGHGLRSKFAFGPLEWVGQETRTLGRRFTQVPRVRRAEREWVRRASPAYDFVGSCPQVEWWGARDMWLFDGPLTAVRSIGAVNPYLDDEVLRRGPQWWWPASRSWFVANEIDLPWSYFAGSSALVDAVLADDALETIEVRFEDRW